MTSTLLASLSKSLWRLSQSLNIDSNKLFQDAGLDPSIIYEPRGRYDVASVHNAWVLAVERTGIENIGLYAVKYYSPNDLHALGNAFLTSYDLIDGLTRISRYDQVLNTGLHFVVETSEDRVKVMSEYVDPETVHYPRVIEDSRHAILINLCRKAVGDNFDPISVSFTYPEPDNISEYLGLFRCELKFNQAHSGLSFSREDCEQKLIDNNRELASGNDQILDKYVSSLQGQSISSKVKQAILERLPSGTPTYAEIADMLHISSRTLARRLDDENTNFRELLTSVRRELANAYIVDETIPITEISYILGFSDLSSFSRAFKVWNGDSPKVFRDNFNT